MIDKIKKVGVILSLKVLILNVFLTAGLFMSTTTVNAAPSIYDDFDTSAGEEQLGEQLSRDQERTESVYNTLRIFLNVVGFDVFYKSIYPITFAASGEDAIQQRFENNGWSEGTNIPAPFQLFVGKVQGNSSDQELVVRTSTLMEYYGRVDSLAIIIALIVLGVSFYVLFTQTNIIGGSMDESVKTKRSGRGQSNMGGMGGMGGGMGGMGGMDNNPGMGRNGSNKGGRNQDLDNGGVTFQEFISRLSTVMQNDNVDEKTKKTAKILLSLSVGFIFLAIWAIAQAYSSTLDMAEGLTMMFYLFIALLLLSGFLWNIYLVLKMGFGGIIEKYYSGTPIDYKTDVVKMIGVIGVGNILIGGVVISYIIRLFIQLFIA